MGLFSANDEQSEEMAALLQAQAILSNCEALQTLLEAEDASTSAALIVVGSSEPPLDGEAYTVGELEDRLAWCQLFPKLDEDSFLCTWSKAVAATPEKEGYFRLHVRRQIRGLEYDGPESRNDVWKYFLNQTSLMCEQFIESADLNLLTKQIKRVQGPVFNRKEDHPTQGIFIFADFLIPWGGSESQ